LTAPACQSSPGPDGTWVIAGPIVARDLQISIGGPPTIHVKEKPAEQCGIIFLVRSSTEIRRRTNSGVIPASYGDLVSGTKVRVWAGTILESCPAQSTADIVEIEQ
jgi:hypothetical protein